MQEGRASWSKIPIGNNTFKVPEAKNEMKSNEMKHDKWKLSNKLGN